MLIEIIRYNEDPYQYELEAYVIQPDHYHLLLDVGTEKTISQIMHSINSYFATQVNNHRGNQIKKKIFEESPWTEIIRDETMYWQKVAYILLNPWREDLVEDPLDEYEFSDLGRWKEDKGEDFLRDLFARYGRDIE